MRASLLVARCSLLVLVLLLVMGQKAPEAEQFVGPPQGQPVTGAALDARAASLSAQLRCPVCQGLAIADSPSEMAINMRRQVRELAGRGFTDEQILRYFEQSYGQFVLLKPKFQGVNSLVWLLPVAVLLFGGLLVFVKARNLTAAPASTPQLPPATDDPYVSRVRDLVKKP
jgi:cytochrome c-type biogenesis protein CcmH